MIGGQVLIRNSGDYGINNCLISILELNPYPAGTESDKYLPPVQGLVRLHRC